MQMLTGHFFLLRGTKNNLTMLIRDNGKGFDINKSIGRQRIKEYEKKSKGNWGKTIDRIRMQESEQQFNYY